MEDRENYIARLEREKDDLEKRLEDANQIIDSIREGAVDALVVSDNSGTPQIFAIETADYTYRILIEKFSEGALSINESGLILYVNESFAKLAGLSPDEILGTNFREYFQVAQDFDALLKTLKNGPVKKELSLLFEGVILDAYLSMTDLHPLVPAIGIVVTDLSEKKNQEKALLQYQEKLQANIEELHLTNTNLEQVIHVISHDLKEPLRKILTYISQVSKAEGETLNTKDIKSLGIVNASAFRLNSLLDDVVKYALTDTPQLIDKVDLNRVIRDVTEDLEISIRESEAKVVYENLPVISGSEVQLRQLLANLISNALKYRRKNVPPVIHIDVLQPSGELTGWTGISIADNGIGMENSYLSQIFTIFKRLHNRNEYSGNGIGLAISKKIMDNHGGKIEVDSIPGQGSTFSLYFPSNVVVDA